jgi:hypothetical protein
LASSVVFERVADANRLEQVGHLPDGFGVSEEQEGAGRKQAGQSSQEGGALLGGEVNEDVAAKHSPGW